MRAGIVMAGDASHEVKVRIHMENDEMMVSTEGWVYTYILLHQHQHHHLYSTFISVCLICLQYLRFSFLYSIELHSSDQSKICGTDLTTVSHLRFKLNDIVQFVGEVAGVEVPLILSLPSWMHLAYYIIPHPSYPIPRPHHSSINTHYSSLITHLSFSWFPC